VFIGYLHLLLNTRDELSLARVINVPNRGLDHRAFTDVKHEAKHRGLSMFQV
jgi:superfamily I DNA/RNA helicase